MPASVLDGPVARRACVHWAHGVGGPQGVGRITRRRPRGIMRVLLEALQQALDDGLQLGNARFEGMDILLDGNGCLLPQFWWEGWHGVHRPRSYATGHPRASLMYCHHLNAYEESSAAGMLPTWLSRDRTSDAKPH